ncbi:MAG: tol-pal system-associated acyl-CoA thioesterase [Pseudomonadota bacterium]
MTADETSGWIEGKIHHFPLRIYYQDTDVSGIVYHAQYLHFFERARTEFLRVLGISQKTLDRDKPETYAAFAVRDLSMDFRRPAQLDDRLIIKTTLRQLKGVSCTLEQQVWREYTLLVRAQIRLVFLSVDLRPRRVPEHMHRLFQAILVDDHSTAE